MDLQDCGMEKNVLSQVAMVTQVCLRIKLVATRNGFPYLNKMISWPRHIITLPRVNMLWP